jgi:hypothetical protein
MRQMTLTGVGKDEGQDPYQEESKLGKECVRKHRDRAGGRRRNPAKHSREKDHIFICNSLQTAFFYCLLKYLIPYEGSSAYCTHL